MIESSPVVPGFQRCAVSEPPALVGTASLMKGARPVSVRAGPWIDRPAHPFRIETSGFHVPVELGGQHEAVRQAAACADRSADAFLAPSEAVIVGGIRKTLENGVQGRADAHLVGLMAMGVAQSGGSETKRGHRQSAGTDGGKGCFGGYIVPSGFFMTSGIITVGKFGLEQAGTGICLLFFVAASSGGFLAHKAIPLKPDEVVGGVLTRGNRFERVDDIGSVSRKLLDHGQTAERHDRFRITTLMYRQHTAVTDIVRQIHHLTGHFTECPGMRLHPRQRVERVGVEAGRHDDRLRFEGPDGRECQ